MGITHIRTPRNFVLEERLERYAAAIEQHPEDLRGRWAEACFPSIGAGGVGRYDRVRLDLGCGKGAFLAACAAREPEALHIGMDVEPICIVYAAQRILEEGLGNAVVMGRGATALGRVFAPGELASMTLNFPTPYPKRRRAHLRLTTAERLVSYRGLLAPGGTLTLRTDSAPLRDYTLTQLDAAGWEVLWVSDDVRAEHPGFPETEYEARLVESGARVRGVCARPGAAVPADAVERGRAAEQSLMRYLPDDLDALDYVPLGMEAAVANLRNRRRNAELRAGRGA